MIAAEELVAKAEKAAKRAPKTSASVVKKAKELRDIIKYETSTRSLYWWPKGKNRGFSDRRYYIYWRGEAIAFVFHDKANGGKWYVTLFPCYIDLLPDLDEFLKKKGVYEYNLKMRRWIE
jgi:hypothetical protein